MKKNTKIIIGIVILLLIAAILAILTKNKITSFEECVLAGNPVLETYPEQCMTSEGEIFTNPNQKPLTEPLDNNTTDTNSPEIYACQAPEECVPMPGCHPIECINKEYESLFIQPDFCTMEYRYDAAYSPEDCFCENNVCVNLNLNRTFEDIESIETDKNQSSESEALNCPDVCTLVWEIKEDGCFFNECGSGCGADYVTTFNTEEECLLTLEYNTSYSK
jgi:hypothetical protein